MHLEHGRHVLVARGLSATAVVLLALGYAAFVLGPLRLGRVSISRDVSFFTILVGLRVLRQARRYRALKVDSPAPDIRQPVLYLRSFKDDRVSARLSRGLFAFTTEEEDLASLLNRIGPCIAFGRPGEALPQIGVRRVYVDNLDWKVEVQRVMATARLVVIRAGSTEGVLEELEMAAAVLPTERLVMLTPKGRRSRRSIAEAFKRTNVLGLTDIPSRGPLGVSIAAAIYFEGNGKPLVQRAKIPFFSFGMFRPAIYALNEALRPAFERTGVPWRPAPRPYARLVLAFMVFGTTILPFLLRLILSH
jgi:hypothetical protein